MQDKPTHYPKTQQNGQPLKAITQVLLTGEQHLISPRTRCLMISWRRSSPSGVRHPLATIFSPGDLSLSAMRRIESDCSRLHWDNPRLPRHLW